MQERLQHCLISLGPREPQEWCAEERVLGGLGSGLHLLLQERDERLEEEEEEGEGYRREGPTLHAAPGGRRS